MNMATATKPPRVRKTGPVSTDLSAVMKRAFKGAHEDVLKEHERRKRLGIIDEDGKLLKRSQASGSKSGDFGGWG
jgi:hypothetical protein